MILSLIILMQTVVLPRFTNITLWQCTVYRHFPVMPESTAIAAVHAFVFIVNIVGNTLVCVIIKRNQDMRYARIKLVKPRLSILTS